MNVLGTMNVLAACGGPDSPVTKVVFKSSAHYYGCERDDPSFFTEDMQRPHPPRTRLESDIVEAEDAVQEFAARNAKVTVTTLRFCNGLGPDLRHQPHRAARPARGARASSGSTRATSSSTRTTSSARCTTRSSTTCPGIHNVAPDGVLALSEVASLLGKPFAPLLPPFGTRLAAAATGRIGMRIPDEVRRQLRYGRGLDNRKLKQSGYRFALTTRGDGAGVCSGAAPETAAGERRGAISLRARSGGIPPLVTERSAR